ncbi:MAG TPA: radical SAM protein, partial [Candidatus Methanoperedens sp.]|nr:radical SAM protein [Candidatus Methanoperedens sp.]
MRVVFHDCGYETFGVQYLLAVTRRAGHEPLLFFDASFNKDYLAQDFFLTGFLSLTPAQIADGILRLEPDVVCFSVYTLFYRENMRVIRALKERRPDVAVVCGGFHPTLLPEQTLRNAGVDFVVLAEAELSLPNLLEAIARHGIAGAQRLGAAELPGVCTLVDGAFVSRGLSPIPPDLDALPFPEKDAYYRENPVLASIYTIVASRGCPYRCTYCNSATMNETYRAHGATYYRVRSVDSVLAELRAALERHRPRHVMFFDDVFAARRDWLREFSRRYREEIGLPFYCQTSPLIHDAESLRLLAESGCCLI